MTTSSRRWLALVALALAPVGSVLWVGVGPATAGDLDPRVFIIGDSVILGAQGAVAARLGASGWQVTQVASESQHTYNAPGVIDANAGAIGDVVVVSLGTNDGITPGQFAGWIDGVMSRLEGVERVYWINLRQFADWVPAANAEIAAAQDRWPNLRVINWDARATPDPGLVYTDGIHLTDAGANAYAELIGSTLDEFAGQEPPSTTTTTTTTTTPRRSRETTTTTTTTTAVPPTTQSAAGSDDGDGGGGIDPLWPLLAGGVAVVAGALGIAFVRARRLQAT